MNLWNKEEGSVEANRPCLHQAPLASTGCRQVIGPIPSAWLRAIDRTVCSGTVDVRGKSRRLIRSSGRSVSPNNAAAHSSRVAAGSPARCRTRSDGSASAWRLAATITVARLLAGVGYATRRPPRAAARRGEVASPPDGYESGTAVLPVQPCRPNDEMAVRGRHDRSFTRQFG